MSWNFGENKLGRRHVRLGSAVLQGVHVKLKVDKIWWVWLVRSGPGDGISKSGVIKLDGKA